MSTSLPFDGHEYCCSASSWLHVSLNSYPVKTAVSVTLDDLRSIFMAMLHFPTSSIGPVVVQCRRSTVTYRSYLVVRPHMWNSLPHDVTSAHSFQLFHSRLKMNVVRHLYCVLCVMCTRSVCPSVRHACLPGVPRRQPHRRSGLATLPSVGAVP